MAARGKAKPPVTLGDALRVERERRQITQRAAAEELNVSQPVFSAWENDQNEPGGIYLESLAGWLSVDLERLFVLNGWSKIARAEVELLAAERRFRR